MGFLYGRAGRFTAQNGGFRPGQGLAGAALDPEDALVLAACLRIRRAWVLRPSEECVGLRHRALLKLAVRAALDPASRVLGTLPAGAVVVPTAQGSTARGFTRVEFRLADAPELSLSEPSEGG